MKWHFVRHGEIQSNLKKVYAGWSNEELTERGIEQAEAAGTALSKIKIEAVHCSPLKRTRQTADIICKKINCLPVPNDDFIEFRLGPWEGLSEMQIADSYPEEWLLWNTFPAELKIPGRETLKELQTRVLGGLSAIERDCEGKESVLIVTHVAIIRVFLLYHGKKDLNAYKKIKVENGKIFSFESFNPDHIK